MNTRALKNKLGGKLSLPSLPDVIVRLQALIHDPACGMKDFGVEISSDPPLAARVLRIANSAFYSLSVPVLDINHATAILGLNTLSTVLLQIGVVDVFRHQSREGVFDPRVLWKHAVLSAQVAASFPKRTARFASKEEVYVCGLLHDIGKFVMYDHLQAEYVAVVERADAEDRLQHDIETEVFGFDHADVGALVVERWGLPEKAVRAVGGHHDLQGLISREPLVALVAAADHIALHAEAGRTPGLGRSLPREIVGSLELTDEEIEALLERTLELRRETAA